MKQVSDLMSMDLVTLSPEHLCYHAMLKMHEHYLRHIPIVDAKGDLVGIISDRDVKQKLTENLNIEDANQSEMEWMLQPLEELMSKAPVTVYPDENIKDVVRLFLNQKISSVVVLPRDSQKPAGILTETDLLRLLQSHL
ncbi:MAG: CBS domain-containing protein [Deltaproteobacteria bacterium]|nr:MAG: CBS domain-containing protein [Deltaproteobacteria bacterium]